MSPPELCTSHVGRRHLFLQRRGWFWSFQPCPGGRGPLESSLRLTAVPRVTTRPVAVGSNNKKKNYYCSESNTCFAAWFFTLTGTFYAGTLWGGGRWGPLLDWWPRTWHESPWTCIRIQVIPLSPRRRTKREKAAATFTRPSISKFLYRRKLLILYANCVKCKMLKKLNKNTKT